MNKNIKLNVWLWKWHFLGGLFSLIFAIIFSITGILYLFRDMYEAPKYEQLKVVSSDGEHLSFQKQWEIINEKVKKKPTSMVIPSSSDEATEFVSGMHGSRVSTYIDPVSGEINGDFSVQKSDMYIIRKLHGELLSGSFGAFLTELAAGWMMVLIISGIYIWWPKKQWKIKGFFTVRTNVKKRLFWRDMHVVFSFWVSVLLFVAVVSGLPYTNFFGQGYSKIASMVKSDYPETWRGGDTNSQVGDEPLSLDQMIEIAQNLNLEGEVSIILPRSEKDAFRVSNRIDVLSKQKVIHLDQYSGEVILSHEWRDIGSMMQVRQWLIRFHEGNLGLWNWWLMLIISAILIFTSIAAIFSYLYRKRKGSWGVPTNKAQFKLGVGIVIGIVIFGIIMPVFGISAGGLWLFEKIRSV